MILVIPGIIYTGSVTLTTCDITERKHNIHWKCVTLTTCDITETKHNIHWKCDINFSEE